MGRQAQHVEALMFGPAMEIICRFSPAHERTRLWEGIYGPVPEGMRIGFTCEVPYCGKLHHMELVENFNHGRANYVQYRERIDALAAGEFFEIPDIPCKRDALVKFRCGLNLAAGLHKIVFRSLPNGGARIYKVGRWETLGVDGFELRPERNAGILLFNTKLTRRGGMRTPMLWLGQWFNPSPRVHRSVPVCKIPACPMPVLHGQGDYCHHHNHWFDYPESMTWNALDHSSVARPWMSLLWQANCALAAEFPKSIAALERSLSFEMTKVGVHRPTDSRHKNLGNDSTVTKTVSNYSRSPQRASMHRGKTSHSSKTTAGKRKAASRQGPGSRHSTKEKRWTRETFEELERQADQILGIDTPENKAAAVVMRKKQASEISNRVYPLCVSYEISEPDLTEEEEREQAIEQLSGQCFFDQPEGIECEI